ncbi:hypothetical protein [Polaromonas sp.]|uniref:ADP-ribosyltransferase-containing protein n=1 Tax=Polaromonas sp. TaxID=1869339 RepID=UPI00352B09EE
MNLSLEARALHAYRAKNEVLLFHGTTRENALQLLKVGCGGRAPTGANQGSRSLLYVTTDPRNALWFSQQAGERVVLQVRVPAAQLVVDPEDGTHDSVEEELQTSMVTRVPGTLAVVGTLGQAAFAVHNQQVDTPQFQEWFGASRVVDHQGAPIVVFHGMSGEFEGNSFGDGESIEGAIFFTNCPLEASWYATSGSGNLHGRGEHVIPVYLALNNPYSLDLRGQLDYEFGRIPEAVDYAKAHGYDGLIVYRAWNGNDETGERGMANETQYVAFKPEQIKSALGNNGDFSRQTSSLLFSMPEDEGSPHEAPGP